MTSQINGLNQGVSNANDGVSMTQTASSGLNQITDNLQRIRQLAVNAATGSLSPSDQAALQKEVTQRIAEVNRIASQTTYNGTNVLDGSAGVKSFQVGANVGQSISVDLSQGVGASKLGTGLMASGSALSTFNNLNLTADGTNPASGTAAAITSINVLSDGKGGFTFTDQNNNALKDTAVNNLFGGASKTAGTGTALPLQVQGALSTTANVANATQTSAINAAVTANAGATDVTTTGTVLATVAINLSADGQPATGSNIAVTSIDITSDGKGGYTYAAKNGAAAATLTATTGQAAIDSLFKQGTASAGSLTGKSGGSLSGDAFASQISAAQAKNVVDGSGAFPASGSVLGTLSVSLDDSGATVTTGATIKSLQIQSDGKGGYTFKAFSDAGAATANTTATAATVNGLFTAGAPQAASLTGQGALLDGTSVAGQAITQAAKATSDSVSLANATNVPPTVANIDISSVNGANAAIESIDNALTAVNGIQAALGAVQNRFTSIASTQTAQSTNLSTAQSQITDANFAQETANLSKAQVLQQAGISVLAQANSLPQQVLKLLG